MMYGSLHMEHNKQNFFSFWTIFCPFTPLTTQKIKILKKFKTPGDIIILQKCTINDNHLMYVSWDMMHNRQIFFVILGHILPFYPTNPKNQNFEKMKKTPRDIIIYIYAPKIIIWWCTVPEIWCVTDVIVISHFGLFFALLQPKKSKFWKNEKKAWRYHHFTYVYQKLWSDDVWFLRYAAQQMDRRMEKVTYRDGWPT